MSKEKITAVLEPVQFESDGVYVIGYQCKACHEFLDPRFFNSKKHECIKDAQAINSEECSFCAELSAALMRANNKLYDLSKRHQELQRDCAASKQEIIMLKAAMLHYSSSSIISICNVCGESRLTTSGGTTDCKCVNDKDSSSKHKKPHKCPVCDGTGEKAEIQRGILFLGGTDNRIIRYTDKGSHFEVIVKCNACEKGVLWK